jgi:DNA-binding LacI/PurR family transcriptional regulator
MRERRRRRDKQQVLFHRWRCQRSRDIGADRWLQSRHEGDRIGASRQQIEPRGFSPSDGARTIHALYAADGAAPAGIFVNSITALEGVARAIRSSRSETFCSTTIACNDWDPFGSMLPLRILMARQNVERLIRESFLLLDRFKPRRYPRVLVMPEFPVSRRAG